MTHDLLKSISQRISGAEDAENRRIYEIAHELCCRCSLYEGELREGKKYVSIVFSRMVKLFSLWQM